MICFCFGFVGITDKLYFTNVAKGDGTINCTGVLWDNFYFWVFISLRLVAAVTSSPCRCSDAVLLLLLLLLLLVSSICLHFFRCCYCCWSIGCLLVPCCAAVLIPICYCSCKKLYLCTSSFTSGLWNLLLFDLEALLLSCGINMCLVYWSLPLRWWFAASIWSWSPSSCPRVNLS